MNPRAPHESDVGAQPWFVSFPATPSENANVYTLPSRCPTQTLPPSGECDMDTT